MREFHTFNLADIIHLFDRYHSIAFHNHRNPGHSPPKSDRALQNLHNPSGLPKQMQAMGISGLVPKSWKKLFSTHPPLEKRIAALQGR